MADKKKVIKKYIVVFQDEDGTVLKTSFVRCKESAVPPEIKKKKGESAHHEIVFCGWDKEYSCIENNLVVKAVYQEVPKKYLVIYFHENGKMLGMESVPYGSAARADIYPEKENNEEFIYTFSGWNRSLDYITEDTNAKAVFEKKRREFTVRFFHADGTLLREEQVEYKKNAHPPKPPEKERDEVYHYYFEKWSVKTDEVTKDLDAYAVFTPVFNEYTVAYYDEDEKDKAIQLDKYHYGEEIIYPEWKNKGYELHWHPMPKKVEQSFDIHAKWVFSNIAGKRIHTDTGIYQIINPSIKNGSVCCVKYADKYNRCINFPQKVKLGDYYYKIERIGPYAFAECEHLRTLKFLANIKVIEEYGLAGCRQLRKIQFGDGLFSLGSYAFSGNLHLKEIILPGKELAHCHKKAFEKIKSMTVVYIHRQYWDKCRKIIGKISDNRITLQKK